MVNPGVLIYMSRFVCWNVAVRMASDQLVSKPFVSFSSKRKSQLINLSESLRSFQSAFLKLCNCVFCDQVSKIDTKFNNFVTRAQNVLKTFDVRDLIFVHSKSNRLSILVGKSITCQRKWSLIALVKRVRIWQSVEAVTVAQSTFGSLKSPTIKSWSKLAFEALCKNFMNPFW